MSKETLAHAAEPFFTTKGIGKGTGLGLAMVKGFVEQSNGHFQIRSEPGKGTTVDLLLPIAERTAPQPRVEAENDMPDIAPLVVLAVDDDPLVLLNAKAMLEDLGHTVVTATSGSEAIEVLDRMAEVDLLITDQAMPHMTGLQLTETVHESWPNVPVIIATGYDEMPAGTQGKFGSSRSRSFRTTSARRLWLPQKSAIADLPSCAIPHIVA